MARELEEDRAAELGYRTAGARELSLRDWMALQGDPAEPAPTPRAFRRLVWRLYARNYWRAAPAEYRAKILAYRKQWAKDNHERYRASVNRNRKRYRADPKNAFHLRELETKRAAWAVKRRARLAATVHACVVCGAQWCPSGIGQLAKGYAPKYCSQPCRSKANYLRMRARGTR